MARIILFPPSKTFPLLLFLLICPPLSTSTSSTYSDDNTVLDDFGKPVLPGVKYSLFVPGSGSAFGSVSMFPKQNNCPPFVAISRDPNDFGPGIEFYPNDPDQKTIQLSSDLTIVFSVPGNCPGKPVWQLTPRQNNGDSADVSADGDQKDNKSWFKVEKSNNPFGGMPYKITHCPQTVSQSNMKDFDCGDLGMKNDKKNIWVDFGVDQSVPFTVAFLPLGAMPPTPPPPAE